MTAFTLPSPGLGTSGNDEFERCAETVATALDAGYRHVDTAQMYDNEAAVGAGIERADVPREEVVVATKIHPDNLSYEATRRTARESLDRLGLDRVDLLYVHWPISAYDPAETLPAFQELVDEGVTDHVAVSNFDRELFETAADRLDAPIVANQVECHPLLPQDDLRALARDHGHHLVAYSPLAGGEILDDPLLSEIATEHDTTTAAVCLAWAASKDSVVPIPKGEGDHVRANYEARSLELSDDALARIDGYDERLRVVDPAPAPWNE
ncbi:aldo/keto reductase [Halobaculum sp. MBLA0143]|uniref:aldo/keto reductase n=1 Tax=Halobaculum sp. MBLA0143 TaxID=3079933 RepID=UPI0035232166